MTAIATLLCTWGFAWPVATSAQVEESAARCDSVCLVEKALSARRDEQSEYWYRLSLETRDRTRARVYAERAYYARPDSAVYLEQYLRSYLADPSVRDTRMGRRVRERSLARRLLDLDGANPLALAVLLRWEFDDVQWNAVNLERFHTGYFERKVREAVGRTEKLAASWRLAHPTDPGWARSLVRTYAYLGRWESVAATADTLIRLAPEYPDGHLFRGLADHELLREGEAERVFGRALALMDGPTRTDWEDVRRLLPPDEAAGTDGESRAAYWATRDTRLITPENERRNEHFARLVMADLFFEGRDGATGWDTIQGVLLVRYGLPHNPITTIAPYDRYQTVGTDPIERPFKFWVAPGGVSLQLEDKFRSGAFQYYQPPADTSDRPPEPNNEAVAARLFRTQPEYYEPEQPGRRVRLPHELNVFKGEGGRSLVIATLGVPIRSDAPEQGLLPATLDAGFFLVGHEGRVAELRRPVAGFRQDEVQAVSNERVWTTTLVATAPAGRYRASIEMELTDRSAFSFEHDSVLVPTFEPDSLSMSDLMLSTLVFEEDEPPPSSLYVRLGGFVVRPVPWSLIVLPRPIYLFFGTYGLAQTPSGSTRYSVTAVLEKPDRPSLLGRLGRLVTGRPEPNAVAVSFTTTGTSADELRYLMLETEGLEPGEYRITVRVEDLEGGGAMERTRRVGLVAE